MKAKISSRYFPLFDNVKLLLMILVIIVHTLYNSYGHYGMELIRFYGTCFTMPLFTFISGYLSKPEVAFRKNVRQLLIPCLVFTIVNDWVMWKVNPDYVFSWRIVGFAMWYLWVLFFYRISLKWLVRIPGILFVSFLFSWAIGFLPVGNHNFNVHRLFTFLPWFLLGYYLSQSEKFKKVLTNANGGVDITFFLPPVFCFGRQLSLYVRD